MDEEEDSDQTWLGTSPESDESLELELEDEEDEEEVEENEKHSKDGSGSDDEGENEQKKKSKSLFDFDGEEIVSKGNYSKCPRCLKNIKSTFILRHIKLHDLPVERYPCPGNHELGSWWCC